MLLFLLSVSCFFFSDCAEAIQKTDGENFYTDVPKQAGMNKMSQADNGDYNFGRKDNTLLSRKKLTGTEGVSDIREGGSLTITLPLKSTLCYMFYTNKWDEKKVTVMKAGNLVKDGPFGGRIRILDSYHVQIVSLTHQDSGSIDVTDQRGLLYLSLQFNIQESSTTTLSFAWISIPVILVFVVIICILVSKKFCCKNTATESAPLIVAVPPTYHTAHQTTGPYPPPYPPFNPTSTAVPRTGFAAQPVAAPAQQRAVPVVPAQS